MDPLLSYLLFRITKGLILIELLIMVVCVIAIIITKSLTRWSIRRRVRIQNELSEIFEKALFNHQPIEKLSLPSNLCQVRNLVEVLENFDHRFLDQRWVEIKNKVVNDYLLKPAEKNINSWSWFSRQLAARTFLLCPEKASEPILRQILNDNRYLVRVVGVVCITKQHYKELFYEMIKKMSLETKLSQFPYRDALVQADQEKFDWLEEILKNERDPAICAICLDVLSTRYSKNLYSLIVPFVNSENAECRNLAIKALGNIPTEESINLLMHHLSDSDWKIRAESINVLQKLYAIQAIPDITNLLNDRVWWVRLQAATALKSFGEEGKKILASQEKEQKPLAYEISQYILAMP